MLGQTLGPSDDREMMIGRAIIENKR